MLEHGGRLRAAAQRYGIALADWVDLSTGINPQPYPVPPLAPEVWQRLPEPELFRRKVNCIHLSIGASSGEVFDVREFTGASNRFPLGSKVAVYRPDTEACVIVRINDRMAGHRKRVIDLSRSAAEALGSLRSGVAIVRVARLDPAHVAALFAGEGEGDARQACRAAFGLPEAPDFYGQPLPGADFSLPVQELGMQ
jgi:hypothetical protein